jgi:predicted metal-dependent HD superfamily phosphohydrolase
VTSAPSFHRHSWARAWSGVGAVGDGAATYAALLQNYSEPHRAYHSLQHLGECLAAFEPVQPLADNPAHVELALWFHDAIYDVHRSDNEALSAEWASAALRAGGAPPNTAEQVSSLVLATQHSAAPRTPDEFVLIDIDLAILGAEPARFAEYEKQIRLEYAFVPEPVFSQKRGAILQSFLDRPRIYSTDHFHTALEQRARHNLQTAIAQSRA